MANAGKKNIPEAKADTATEPVYQEYSGGDQHVYSVGTAITIFWTGAGTASAPSATSLRNGVLGANSDGASTGNVYHVVEGAWVDTSATVANIYGA